METKRWMIYGANGYSGRLISEEAFRRGEMPIIAGRNDVKINPIAKRFGAKTRAFTLNNEQEVVDNLHDVDLLLNCAGPFSKTAEPLIKACIQTKTHYLDITGEVDVFEMAKKYSVDATKAGIIICPGVGFDVIPTDCMATYLKKKMPDATELFLGFSGGGSLSPGTAKTMLENLDTSTLVRRNGKLDNIPFNSNIKSINYGHGELTSMPISWGDLSTAYTSTEIPNITVYVPTFKHFTKVSALSSIAVKLLKKEKLRNLAKTLVEKNLKGPNEERRKNSQMNIWGEVRNKSGQKISATFSTVNGYDLTVQGALAICLSILENKNTGSGYTTPAILMGSDFVFTIKGTSDISHL